jgi:hypothetical protein
MQVASCHADRRHYAKGLCEACYSRGRRLKDPNYHEKARLYTARWGSTERGRAYRKAYDSSPKRRDAQRAYNASAKAKVVRYRSQLKKRHGLTVTEFERIWSAQGFRCALASCSPCKGLRCLDHFGEGDKRINRGVLCSKHNRALGLLGDTAEGLAVALAYLTEYDLRRIAEAK